MKRSLAWLLVASVVCVGILSAQSTVSAEEITLKVISTTIVEKPEGDVLQAITDKFMELNPDIKIEFIGVPANNLATKVQTMAIGGELPDIFTNNPDFMGKPMEMGIAADLEGLLGEDYIKGFYPAIVDQCSLDGKLQLVPHFSIPMGLLYRGDWFEEEGITSIETWDEFLAAAQKLTKDTDGDGNIDRWGFAMVGSKNGSGGARFIQILRTFGADGLRDENGEWVTDLDSDKSKKAFQFFTDLFTKHGVVPPGPTEVSYGEAVSLMASGKTAMMVTGPHSIGAILAQNPDIKGKIFSAVLPKDERHISALGIGGFSISEASPHKEAAVKYLKFVVNTENGVEWNRVTGRMPSRIEAGEQPQISGPVYEGFVKALAYVVPVPSAAPFYSQLIGDVLGVAYQSMLVGGVDVDTATEQAAASTRELIEQAE